MSDENDDLVEAGLEDDLEAASGELEEEMTDDWAAALEEQEVADASEDDVSAQPLDELMDNSEAAHSENPDLEVILDIPVNISMVVGNTQISIRNLLQLNQGSVIELDRLAGEPLDVMVNDTLIAHGEVVVVNEKFGIRLTDVISAAERIRKLG